MHYMADIYEKFDVWAFDMIDSSPQKGWHFLVIRTDEFAFPKCLSHRARLAIVLDHVYMRRTAPLTCLGYGKAGLAEKVSNYAHAGCLETGRLARCGSSIIKQRLFNNPIRQAGPIGSRHVHRSLVTRRRHILFLQRCQQPVDVIHCIRVSTT